jgi:hypothetical protein
MKTHTQHDAKAKVKRLRMTVCPAGDATTAWW